MTLEPAALAKLVQIIDGIYSGEPTPRISGRFGHFLRTCHSARLDVQQVLAREGVSIRAEGWASGKDIGEIALTPLDELRGSVPTELWGPVEHAPMLCEQLGFVIDLTLWTSARAANRAHVLLSESSSPLRLQGTYRWFAPCRITPGEALVELETAPPANWRTARFLKATANDVGRPPHPLEYVPDYRLGAPGLKVFRTFTIQVVDGGLAVLPGVAGESRPIQLSTGRVPLIGSLSEGDVGIVFAFREPWSEVWTVVDGAVASISDCLEHALTWSDFQAEIRGEPPLAFGDVEVVRTALAAVGVAPPATQTSAADANLHRQLVPSARALVRWLRYRT